MPFNFVGKVTLNYHNDISLNQYRNVWFYRTSAVTEFTLSLAADLADAFGVAFQLHLRNAHSDNYTFDNINVEGLDGVVFHVEQWDVGGTITASVLPPHATFSVRLRRTTGETRDGWKRFSSIPEGQCNDAGQISYIAGQWTTAVQGIRDACALTLNGVSDDYVPIIYRRPRPQLAEAYTDVASAQLSPYAGSQNTRKFGRGI